MSKAYPSNLTREQYEFLCDLIPDAKPGVASVKSICGQS